jgi:hypothetical protein
MTTVPAASPDPIAAAWRSRFPANIRAGGRDLLDALSAEPQLPAGIPVPPNIIASDSAFRAEVTRLYVQMRKSLGSGDLTGFAAAYDSLGAVVGTPVR